MSSDDRNEIVEWAILEAHKEVFGPAIGVNMEEALAVYNATQLRVEKATKASAEASDALKRIYRGRSS